MLFHFNINLDPLNLDILNDFLGAILVYRGVRFMKDMVTFNEGYKSAMRIAYISSIIQIFFSFLNFFVFELQGWPLIFKLIINLYIIRGMILFCKGMIIFSNVHHLKKTQPRWDKSRSLFFWTYFIPVGMLTIIEIIFNVLDTTSFYYTSQDELGILFTIGLCIIFFYPIGYALITINKMKKEIRQGGGMVIEESH